MNHIEFRKKKCKSTAAFQSALQNNKNTGNLANLKLMHGGNSKCFAVSLHGRINSVKPKSVKFRFKSIQSFWLCLISSGRFFQVCAA